MTDRLSLPARTIRNRGLALAAIFLAQTVFFGVFLERPLRVIADNVRYELAAWNLVSGRGLSLPYRYAADPTVRGWVCTRHPGACSAADGTYPAAIYPPGYTVALAGIYLVAGRSLGAVMLVHWVLLLTTFLMLERLAHRLLDEAGYWFVVAVAVTYPFLAQQAGLIMSDHLHVFLLFAAFAAWLSLRPGTVRGALFGLAVATATLVRPYCLFALPFLFLWPAAQRGGGATRREWLVSIVAFALPFALWVARNYYWFGQFIPLSTGTLGASLYANKLEWEIGDSLSPERHAAIYAAVGSFGGDVLSHDVGRRLARLGVQWILEHPLEMLVSVLARIPRLWISVGYSGHGVSSAAALLVPYLGGLWAIGLAGMWLRRRDPRLLGMAATILAYWAFLLHTPAEARRTLPLRLLLLIYAGFAVDAFVRRLPWLEERRIQPSSRAPTSSGRGRIRGRRTLP